MERNGPTGYEAHKTQKPNLYFNVINFINDFKLLVRETLSQTFHFCPFLRVSCFLVLLLWTLVMMPVAVIVASSYNRCDELYKQMPEIVQCTPMRAFDQNDEEGHSTAPATAAYHWPNYKINNSQPNGITTIALRFTYPGIVCPIE